MEIFRKIAIFTHRNVPYLAQQSSAVLQNTTAFTKTICCVTILGYLLTYFDGVVENLSVVPGYVLPPHFRIWTLFLFLIFEIHLWEVLLDVLTIGLCGKLLEPLWGPLEMCLFFFVCNFGVAVTCVVFYSCAYAITFDPGLLFDTQLHGLIGYLAGVSVAVRQIIPDNVVFSSPLGRITNRNVPLLCETILIILWLIGLISGTSPVMFACGIWVSWIYLRFYQFHNNGVRGDFSDGFCFASFFPNVLQPPISIITNSFYKCLVKVGICRKIVRKYDMAQTGVTVTLPGIDAHDMERRRQIALKALNERVAKASKSKMQAFVQPRMMDVPDGGQLTGMVGPSQSSKTSNQAKNSDVVSISIPDNLINLDSQ